MFIGFLKGVAYVRSDAFFWSFGDGIGLAIIDQLPYAFFYYLIYIFSQDQANKIFYGS